MSTKLETASPADALNLAMKRMLVHNIHHLPVMEHDQLVGLLSVRDLDAIGTERDRDGFTVEAAMITRMNTVLPDSSVQEAAALLKDNHIGCLPVLENGHLVGMVTVTDILALICNSGVELHHTST